jgi:CRP-like cAMP-binding protein
VEIERQLAWPCHGCTVRATNFCSALIERAPASPSAAKDQISQIFFTADRNEIVRHGTHGMSSSPYVLCKGWAFRFHRFQDGRRQILSVLIPGDMFFTSTLGNHQPDYAVYSATDIKFCELDRDDIRREIAGKPSTSGAFGRLCVQDGDETIAATVNFSERNFTTRIANFVRGIVKRLAARNIKLAADVYPFPLTHADIADATGLDIVDVNRAIQFLRADRIIDLSNGELTIINPEKFEGRPPTPIRHDITSAISHSEIRLL